MSKAVLNKPGDQAERSQHFPIRALSIQQPWVWAIFHAGKDLENRNWRPSNPGLKFRGPLLVHASKTYDKGGDAFLQSQGFDLAPAHEAFETYRGGLAGIVDVTGLLTASESSWYMGFYAFRLDHREELPYIPCRGQQGFFRPLLSADQELELSDALRSSANYHTLV